MNVDRRDVLNLSSFDAYLVAKYLDGSPRVWRAVGAVLGTVGVANYLLGIWAIFAGISESHYLESVFLAIPVLLGMACIARARVMRCVQQWAKFPGSKPINIPGLSYWDRVYVVRRMKIKSRPWSLAGRALISLAVASLIVPYHRGLGNLPPMSQVPALLLVVGIVCIARSHSSAAKAMMATLNLGGNQIIFVTAKVFLSDSHLPKLIAKARAPGQHIDVISVNGERKELQQVAQLSAGHFRFITISDLQNALGQ